MYPPRHHSVVLYWAVHHSCIVLSMSPKGIISTQFYLLWAESACAKLGFVCYFRTNYKLQRGATKPTRLGFYGIVESLCERSRVRELGLCALCSTVVTSVQIPLHFRTKLNNSVSGMRKFLYLRTFSLS